MSNAAYMYMYICMYLFFRELCVSHQSECVVYSVHVPGIHVHVHVHVHVPGIHTCAYMSA